MPLSDDLQLKLRKPYASSSMISMTYKGNDLMIRTDAEGNAVVLFIGKKDATGKIKGQRYARTLKKNSSGEIIKDHWDLKGKTS